MLLLGILTPCWQDHGDSREPICGFTPPSRNAMNLDKRTSGDMEGAGIWGDSLAAVSHIKLSQDAFSGNPPVSLVAPMSLLMSTQD